MSKSIVLLLFSIFTVVLAQSGRETWERVYTGDDEIIEMNTTRVTFGENNIGRVTFRTVYHEPQRLKERANASYQSRYEKIEFKCQEREYRTWSVQLLDSTEKVVDSYELDLKEKWQSVRWGGMMNRLFTPACKLIAERRRNPSTEANQ